MSFLSNQQQAAGASSFLSGIKMGSGMPSPYIIGGILMSILFIVIAVFTFTRTYRRKKTLPIDQMENLDRMKIKLPNCYFSTQTGVPTANRQNQYGKN